jgi:Ca2+-binding EF-hand superfamily protein
MFMQTDDSIKWNALGNTVTAIAGAPLDPKKIYKCVMNYLTVFEALDSIEPIVKYAQEQKKANNAAFLLDIDTTIELKQLLVGHFAKLLLFNMLSPEKVLAMDQDHDGVITKEEFSAAAKLIHGEDVSDLLVDNLFNIADADKNGKIDKKEIEDLLRLAKKTYVETTPVGEVMNMISDFFTTLTGSIDSAGIGAQVTKSFSFDSTAAEDAKKVVI